ncbi:MAG: nuclear transport factor 2 family protein [Betaproteobacteria bacterium]|nr:MAG: nuclear transport factor 2 family protein [Betaproteobacteria bacterium]TAG46827.1 MAG: nuclear transport factor 2 family protein [Betaproteobacteria bacterium]
MQSESINRVVNFYESLTPESLPQIRDLYASDAYFKDPFNEVRDVAAIEQIFAHMFTSLDRPRFVVHTKIEQGQECFLAWDFKFHIRKFKPDVEQCIRGGSHLKFESAGKVSSHRDYWDAAEELYEKLPVVGGFMRFLKRQVG